MCIRDSTNASRTMRYNIRTLDWDDTLLKALDIPRCILPRVADSSEVYGLSLIHIYCLHRPGLPPTAGWDICA